MSGEWVSIKENITYVEFQYSSLIISLISTKDGS